MVVGAVQNEAVGKGMLLVADHELDGRLLDRPFHAGGADPLGDWHAFRQLRAETVPGALAHIGHLDSAIVAHRKFVRHFVTPFGLSVSTRGSLRSNRFYVNGKSGGMAFF